MNAEVLDQALPPETAPVDPQAVEEERELRISEIRNATEPLAPAFTAALATNRRARNPARKAETLAVAEGMVTQLEGDLTELSELQGETAMEEQAGIFLNAIESGDLDQPAIDRLGASEIITGLVGDIFPGAEERRSLPTIDAVQVPNFLRVSAEDDLGELLRKVGLSPAENDFAGRFDAVLDKDGKDLQRPKFGANIRGERGKVVLPAVMRPGGLSLDAIGEMLAETGRIPENDPQIVSEVISAYLNGDRAAGSGGATAILDAAATERGAGEEAALEGEVEIDQQLTAEQQEQLLETGQFSAEPDQFVKSDAFLQGIGDRDVSLIQDITASALPSEQDLRAAIKPNRLQIAEQLIEDLELTDDVAIRRVLAQQFVLGSREGEGDSGELPDELEVTDGDLGPGGTAEAAPGVAGAEPEAEVGAVGAGEAVPTGAETGATPSRGERRARQTNTRAVTRGIQGIGGPRAGGLENLSKSTLQSFATDLGAEVAPRANKATLVSAIETALGESEEAATFTPASEEALARARGFVDIDKEIERFGTGAERDPFFNEPIGDLRQLVSDLGLPVAPNISRGEIRLLIRGAVENSAPTLELTQEIDGTESPDTLAEKQRKVEERLGGTGSKSELLETGDAQDLFSAATQQVDLSDAVGDSAAEERVAREPDRAAPSRLERSG